MDFLYCLYAVADILYSGYLYFIPALLVTFFIVKKYRSKVRSLLAASNGWFAIGNLFWMVQFGFGFLPVLYNQNSNEGYFYYSRTNIFLPYGITFWLHIFLLTGSVLFFFRWFRKSVGFTIVIVAGLLLTSEKFIKLLTGLYRDYLPSSWSISRPEYWWENSFFHITVYVLLIASTYFIQQKRFKPVQSS